MWLRRVFSPLPTRCCSNFPLFFSENFLILFKPVEWPFFPILSFSFSKGNLPSGGCCCCQWSRVLQQRLPPSLSLPPSFLPSFARLCLLCSWRGESPLGGDNTTHIHHHRWLQHGNKRCKLRHHRLWPRSFTGTAFII